MKKLNRSSNDNIQDLIFFFYLAPFTIFCSILILLEGNLTHFASGMKYEAFQARGIATVIILVFCYGIYSLLYKIPLQNHGIENVKIIRKKLLYSSFLYTFLLTLVIAIFLESILPGYLWLTIVILLLLVCFITQWQFVKDVRKYIE